MPWRCWLRCAASQISAPHWEWHLYNFIVRGERDGDNFKQTTCVRPGALLMMRAAHKALAAILTLGLLFIAFHFWTTENDITADKRKNQALKIRSLLAKKISNSVKGLDHISYHSKESMASRLMKDTCVCEGDNVAVKLPFSDVLFPRVWAENFLSAVQDSGVKSRRIQEYDSFQKRSYSPLDTLIIAEANSPLQYPTQGVEVQPLKTIIIPGLGLKEKPKAVYMVNLTATMGTFDVAATVDAVSITGVGQMHIGLSSGLLPNMNRQLQFVTYTNTLFHPRTADTVHIESCEHHSIFTIKIGHVITPKLMKPSFEGESNISSLVTIATKTFLRYDKLQDLIDSIRQFYPDITIVIADDNKLPKPIRGPHIEHYIMPFAKGWFAGRNLAISQITTKYVLWVDDDFIFTAKTKLEKLVDILEKTTLDLVGGAVREVTGYTATYRHTIFVEKGDDNGDCLHMRHGYHHTIEGFPNCVVADAVINFFLARTDKVRQVGFDPRLSRAAHLEFFIDGLGSLYIGSCDDVIVNHASKIKLPWGKSKSEKEYAKFRYTPANNTNKRSDFYYFKSRFQCMTSS